MDLSDILTKIQTLDDIYRMKETRMICIKYLLFLLNLTFSVSRRLYLSVLLKEKCRRVTGQGEGILFLIFRNGYDAM